MKRHGLLIVTLFTVGLTGFLMLTVSGASGSPHRPSLPRHAESASLTRPHLQDESVRRWLQGEPRHWRDCLLHH